MSCGGQSWWLDCCCACCRNNLGVAIVCVTTCLVLTLIAVEYGRVGTWAACLAALTYISGGTRNSYEGLFYRERIWNLTVLAKYKVIKHKTNSQLRLVNFLHSWVIKTKWQCKVKLLSFCGTFFDWRSWIIELTALIKTWFENHCQFRQNMFSYSTGVDIICRTICHFANIIISTIGTCVALNRRHHLIIA